MKNRPKQNSAIYYHEYVIEFQVTLCLARYTWAQLLLTWQCNILHNSNFRYIVLVTCLFLSKICEYQDKSLCCRKLDTPGYFIRRL